MRPRLSGLAAGLMVIAFAGPTPAVTSGAPPATVTAPIATPAVAIAGAHITVRSTGWSGVGTGRQGDCLRLVETTGHYNIEEECDLDGDDLVAQFGLPRDIVPGRYALVLDLAPGGQAGILTITAPAFGVASLTALPGDEVELAGAGFAPLEGATCTPPGGR